MDKTGLVLVSRYAYPPNSFSLCGPEKQKDLLHYSENLTADLGTAEIIGEFSTLYPYLKLIAGANRIRDPFDKDVVDAYWVGNRLLDRVGLSDLVRHMEDDLSLHKKIKRIEREKIYKKAYQGGVPNHNFHVLNVYIRTGNIESQHSLETMDMCVINSGRVIELTDKYHTVLSSMISYEKDGLYLKKIIKKRIFPQGGKDKFFKRVKKGDIVSYHWGYLCEIIDKRKEAALQYYLKAAILHANKK